MEDSNTGNRGLLVTEPTASHQLYAYYADGPYGHIVEGTLGHYRNSYHWDRAQYDAVTPAGKADPLHMGEDDVLKASGKHFLHGPNFGYDGSVSDTVEASGPAGDLTTLRSGIYNFQYQGQGDPIYIGTLKRVTRIIAPTGDGIDITRNGLGRPLTITYRQGNFLNATYVNTYDATGRYLQTQQGPRGEWTRRYGYHTEYQGDAAHLLATVTDALNQITRYTYDTNLMKLTGITFPSGLVQSNVYYQSGTWKGFPLQQLDVGIATNCFLYDKGNVIVQTNEMGLAITNIWDSLNRLISTRFPDGTTISNVYSKLDLVAVKDRRDRWTHYTYNGVRQLIGVTNANNAVTIYSYCGCGSPDSIIRSNATSRLTTTFSYDMAGRLTTTLYPDGYQVSRTFDPITGLVQNITDSGGRWLEVGFLWFNMGYGLDFAKMHDGSGGTQDLLRDQEHDEYGRLISSTDRNGVTVSLGYDYLNRVTTRHLYGISDAQGVETFVYDARGLSNYFDPLGKTNKFVRDAPGGSFTKPTPMAKSSNSPTGRMAS